MFWKTRKKQTAIEDLERAKAMLDSTKLSMQNTCLMVDIELPEYDFLLSNAFKAFHSMKTLGISEERLNKTHKLIIKENTLTIQANT